LVHQAKKHKEVDVACERRKRQRSDTTQNNKMPKPIIAAIFALLALVAGALANAAAVKKYADEHWNCADIHCKTRVSAGSAQPKFQCAEFVARSLAAGGYIPGLGPNDSQSAYAAHKHGGKVCSLFPPPLFSPVGRNFSYRKILFARRPFSP